MANLTIGQIQKLAHILNVVTDYTKTQEAIIQDIKSDLAKYSEVMTEVIKELQSE